MRKTLLFLITAALTHLTALGIELPETSANGDTIRMKYDVQGEPLILELSSVALSTEEQNDDALLEQVENLRNQIDAPSIVLIKDSKTRAPSASHFENIRKFFTKKNVTIDEIKIPAEESEVLTPLVGDLFRHPKPRELKMGIALGIYRGVTTGTVWFGHSPVSALVATILTTVQTTITFGLNGYQTAFDTLFAKSFKQAGGTASKTAQWLRRQGVGLMLTEIVRAISGPVGHLQSVFSLMGQAQILTYIGITGSIGNFLDMARVRIFGKGSALGMRFSLLTFLVTTPLALLEMAGFGKTVLLDLHFYQVTSTTAEMLGTYLALAASAKFFPKTMDKILYAPDRIWNKIKKLVVRARPPICDDYLVPNGVN